MELKNTENIITLGVFLGVLCAVATGLLAVTDQLTKAPIEASALAKINQSLREALPPFDNNAASNTCVINSSDGEKIPVVFHGAVKDGVLVGVAGITFSKRGYGGKVEVMTGMRSDGKIRTVLVTQQNETPGLGSNICERKRKLTVKNMFEKAAAEENEVAPNPILDQFAGHSEEPSDKWGVDWKVKKDGGTVDFVTGATVTTRAVTDAVNRAAKTYMEHKAEITAKLSGQKN